MFFLKKSLFQKIKIFIDFCVLKKMMIFVEKNDFSKNFIFDFFSKQYFSLKKKVLRFFFTILFFYHISCPTHASGIARSPCAARGLGKRTPQIQKIQKIAKNAPYISARILWPLGGLRSSFLRPENIFRRKNRISASKRLSNHPETSRKRAYRHPNRYFVSWIFYLKTYISWFLWFSSHFVMKLHVGLGSYRGSW